MTVTENVFQARTDKSRELQARIISGSIVLLSGSSLATAINLAYNIAVARFLGPQGYGHATAVFTLLTLLSAVTLSFQIVSTKMVAQQVSAQLRDAVYRDLHRSAWACGVIVGLLLVLFQGRIAHYLNLPSPLLVVLLGVGAAFYVPLGTRRGYVQGAYGFRRLATNLVVEGSVRLGGSLLMIGMGYGVTGVIAANAAAIAVAYFAIAPQLSPRTANPLRFGDGFREVSQAIVFFSGQVLINNCDIVLVKHFFASETAGLYAAVAMVGRVTFAFSSAVVNSMFPVVAGARHEERKNLSLIGTSLLMVLAVGSLLAVCLRLTPPWIWTRLFGPSFELPGPYAFPYLLALYAITTVTYCLSVVIITYEMSYKIANNSWLQLGMSALVIAGICRYHSSLRQVIVVQLLLMLILLLLVGVPFLIQAIRNARVVGVADGRAIRLVRRISEDEVIAEFLKSDFDNVAYRRYHQSMRKLVFAPDLGSKLECSKRRALLYLRHRALWKELPVETEWYEAQLSQNDIQLIRVFPRAQWRKLARGNFALTRVAERMRTRQDASHDPFVAKIAGIRQGLLQQEAHSGSIVLIGLNENEPLTILDGNHRFVAAVLEERVDRLRFVCGLSPKMTRCCWYKTDLRNLTRYGGHLLRHVVRRPETELERLFERYG